MAVTKNPLTFTFPEVRVVEASAGSGKTFALAKRYVQLLLMSNSSLAMRHILAITFTNKAATEMKMRILDFLKKTALKQLSSVEAELILKPIQLSEKEASQRAYILMADLMRHYNFFQVQTIDSFINALLSGCAFKINLSANFQIQHNSGDYIDRALDRLIDHARNDKKIANEFRYFLHQFLFIENRTSWFPKKDMLNVLKALFRQYNIYGKNFTSCPTEQADIVVLKKTVLKNMRHLNEQLPEQTHATFRKNLENFLKLHEDSFDIDHLSDYFARPHFPIRKGEIIPEIIEKLWKDIRRGLREVCEQEAFSLFDAYVGIFERMITEFQGLAQRDDVLFLEELNPKARSLFDEGQLTVDELYYRLATRFRHYLLDEFQDTSALQWFNLHLMIEEALSTGGSFFYVGDKKQAIYSFRGGDVRLFDRIQKEYSTFDVYKERLQKNFRSARAIVEFNNFLFSQENLTNFLSRKEEHDFAKKKFPLVHFSDQDREVLLSTFATSQQQWREENDHGYVHITRIEQGNKDCRDEEICEQLLKHVADIEKRFDYGDIAILTRNNAEVERVTTWLLESNLPVESDRTSDIRLNTYVQEFISFLRFLDSPIDNLSFVHFILGDVFTCVSGLTQEELRSFVFDVRKNKSKQDSYLYKDFQSAYPAIWSKFFDPFFKTVGLYPLYEFVTSIVARFDLFAHCVDQQGYWKHLMELIRSFEKEQTDLGSFLEYFENLQGDEAYASFAEHNAIRVLTVHKSKGLEFPVVITPFLGMDIVVGSARSGGQQSYILRDNHQELSLIRLKEKYLKFSPGLTNVYTQEYKESLAHELNNVYVALTRAVHELYIYLPSKIGATFNVAQLLIPEDVTLFGSTVNVAKEERVVQHLKKLDTNVSMDWFDVLEQELSDTVYTEDRARIVRGNMLHFILSFVCNINFKDLQNTLEEAQRAMSRYGFVAEDGEILFDQVRNVVGQDHLKEVFFPNEGEVFCEKEVVDQQGRMYRIDRMIVDKEKVRIIDYKSTEDTSIDHTAQLNNYRAIVADLYPDHQVVSYLLFLDSAQLKEVVK